MGSNNNAALKTILYSDIFNYPLTFKEVWEYLISSKRTSRKTVSDWLKKSPHISHVGNYFCLKGREKIIEERVKKIESSKNKRNTAEKIAKYLSNIPSILFIGLSGALAMDNSDLHDDIDFFVITSKNALWITRLLSIVFLQVLGYRRQRKAINVSNKVCLNMFISQDQLRLPEHLQNVYTAHEIAQVKILVNRHNTYAKFIDDNKWIQTHLPNVNIQIKKSKNRKGKKSEFLYQFLSLFEKPARLLQLFLINRHKTTEIVSDTLLAFHPKDYRKWVLKEYNKRLTKYEI